MAKGSQHPAGVDALSRAWEIYTGFLERLCGSICTSEALHWDVQHPSAPSLLPISSAKHHLSSLLPSPIVAMSQPSPSASLVSLATTTEDMATPTASTTNLIPHVCNQDRNSSILQILTSLCLIHSRNKLPIRPPHRPLLPRAARPALPDPPSRHRRPRTTRAPLLLSRPPMAGEARGSPRKRRRRKRRRRKIRRTRRGRKGRLLHLPRRRVRDRIHPLPLSGGCIWMRCVHQNLMLLTTRILTAIGPGCDPHCSCRRPLLAPSCTAHT